MHPNDSHDNAPTDTATQLRTEVLAAYGGECDKCSASDAGALTLVLTAEDGEPPVEPERVEELYTQLRKVGFLKRAQVNKRWHRITLRCRSCPEALFASLFDGCAGSVQLVSIKPDVDVGIQGHVTMSLPCDWPVVLAWGREESAKGNNAYFVCPTQPPGSTAMRSAATAYEVAFLWADVDGLADPVKKAAAVEQLKASGRITHLVDSGAGLHVDTKLPEPIRVTDENRQALTDALYAFGVGLYEMVHGTKPAKVDRHDLASILRIPGTANYPNKIKREAGRVVTPTGVVWQSSTRIALSAFDDWREKYPRPADTGAESLKFTKEDIHLPAAWDTWLAEDGDLRARFERTQPGPNQRGTTPSEYLFSLFNRLAAYYRDRITDGEAIGVGEEFYRQVGKKKARSTIKKSWAKAKAAHWTTTPHDGSDGSSGNNGGSGLPDTTDVENARRFARQHGDSIRYVYPWKRWHVFDRTHWAEDKTGAITRLAQQTAEAILREAFQFTGDDEKRKQRIAQAFKTKDHHRIQAMLAQAQALCSALPETFDCDPWLFNCLNGTINLKTGELRPHQQGDFITKIVPVAYDPGARSEMWERFLHDSTGGNTETIAFLQRAAGYTLTGVTDEEVLFFTYGPTGTGKTTFNESLRGIMGENIYALTISFGTLAVQRFGNAPRYDVADLCGKRLATSGEIKEGTELEEGLVKTMTGGDMVPARQIYERAFRYKPEFKLWLASNYAPKVRGDDPAMWRRIIRIPFKYGVPPERRDPAVKKALSDPNVSGPAILAWAVQGCLDWQRRGLGVPPEVVEDTKAYQAEMDTFNDFLEDCCIRGRESETLFSDLFRTYEAWRKRNRERPLTRKAFAAQLVEHGFKPKTGASTATRVYTGIGLASAGFTVAPVAAEPSVSEGAA